MIDSCVFAGTDNEPLVLAINMDEGGHVFGSCDYGVTWDNVWSVQFTTLTCTAQYEKYLLIGTRDGMHLMNSITKHTIPFNSDGLTHNYITCFAVSDSMIFVGTLGGSVFRIKKSAFIKTGIEDQPVSNIISIYPNPVSDYIKISSNHALEKIEIFSAIGMKVIETEWKERIDVSGLLPGVYFVKFGDKVSKFIKI